jgi:hypothetical protein
VSLTSIVLTPFAGAYYLDGVGHGGGPVETLPERVLDKGAWCCLVVANTLVDILQQSLPLLDGDAALQDSNGALLIKFLIQQDI